MRDPVDPAAAAKAVLLSGEGVVLLVFTDGRPALVHEAIHSFDRSVSGPIEHRIIIDDAADPAFGADLDVRYRHDGYEIVHHATRRGFAGAIQSGWDHALRTDCRWVFHLEDDFAFGTRVDLAVMAAILRESPHLVQLALQRQAWNRAEIAAGGVVAQHPEAYESLTNGFGVHWLEHRLFWTTNPSLYRVELCEGGWPQVARSEGVFTHRLLASDPNVRFGYMGRKTGAPWVIHGGVRAGCGY